MIPRNEDGMKNKQKIALGCSLALGLLLSACGLGETTPTYEITTAPPTPVVRTATFAVVGDIMVHDYQYNEAYDSATDTYDFMHNFQDMKPYFADKDLVLGNLELTFGGPDRRYASFPCFNTPDSFLDAVKDAGFDLLTTANNHSMDTGRNGVIRTLDKLDEYGIDHMGTYRSAQERDEILIKDINGIRFAFLSYTYGTNGIPVPDDYLVNIIDQQQMVSDITRASTMADMVVVMPHLGNEYESYSRPVFQEWIQLMVDAGADIVLASHPHVLQPMEYRTLYTDAGESYDGFVIYSMGNFISSQTTPPRNASIVLNLTIEQSGNSHATVKDVSFMPIWTQFRNGQDQNEFVVRSVYERLTLPQEQKNTEIRRKDQNRLLEIHKETAEFLLNKDISLDEMRNIYEFPKN